MQTKYSYWVFRDAISEKDRKKIKRTASKNGYSNAAIKKYDNTAALADKKIRNTDISFSEDQYVYDLFCPFVRSANESAGWRYDIDWFEDVQLARYKKNQHYSWHRDGSGDYFGAYKDGNYEGKVRKVSLVACLSNGYVGGDLELSLQRQEEENEILHPEMKVGDVIVFPSFVFHRSTPITKGTKYSAAMWCLGPPFK